MSTGLRSPAAEDTLAYFQLKPIRVARVSEISETTLAAPLPDEERINFHIGNPLQDSRLSSAFLRIALGIDVFREELRDDNPQAVREFLSWEAAEQPRLDFLIRTIQRSVPYLPRGGYSRQSPHPLVKSFRHWLENQQEPLHYDLGESSGRREILLCSGGTHETLRVLLMAISAYLERLPARVLAFGAQFLPGMKEIPNLIFEALSLDERVAREQIEQGFRAYPEVPAFLVIGRVLCEETRRRMRLLCLQQPLFFIEINDAPNHLSLAREAKLVQRVIRLLTPAVFSPRLRDLSITFTAGNADFLNVMENVHFNLKGTPSAADVELTEFLVENVAAPLEGTGSGDIAPAELTPGSALAGEKAERVLLDISERLQKHLTQMLDEHTQTLTGALQILDRRVEPLSRHLNRLAEALQPVDEFAALDSGELLDALLRQVHEESWRNQLQTSFLSAFLQHHTQYLAADCVIVSGSSRTALGLLGFHCGLREVIIPDLSWSYEQCFPVVHAVPLSSMLELDVDAIIQKAEELRRQDPSWPQRGAVVVNSPHNATGRVFNAAAVQKLILYCLRHDLYLIDDLAYQNVLPADDLPEIRTVRQLTTELVQWGLVTEEQAQRVVTVHSLSKMDCLAGARLAVVEIRDPELKRRFVEWNASIKPNIAAVFLGYLFYRSSPEAVRVYWKLRNRLLAERTQALITAVQNLPAERNPYELEIIPPVGGMYPLLRVNRLPAGLSLDWLATSLARQGIGLLPLSTFARTEEGFEIGRTTFRLTLGGKDGAETLLAKTRRLLIHLNRLITEEERRYNRKTLPVLRSWGHSSSEPTRAWQRITEKILQECQQNPFKRQVRLWQGADGKELQRAFLQEYLPERLEQFRIRWLDRFLISEELLAKAEGDDGSWLTRRLESELMKDDLRRRQEEFRSRTHDRTVHPTQMYSLQVEIHFDELIRRIIFQEEVTPDLIEKIAHSLQQEYLGRNVSISSQQEADEILVELSAQIAAEEYTELFTGIVNRAFISFWSDWDGSNRPSGQGHRLIAAVVMENVRCLARILSRLRQTVPAAVISPDLLAELSKLPQRNQRFVGLLNQITQLTHQLEQRYRGILPYSVSTSTWQRLAVRWGLRRDPARVLWEHNDRYERRMLELRRQRRDMLAYYFALNKRLRKQLHALIPVIVENRSSRTLLREVVNYRDLLQRTVITPRLHQEAILAQDQFAIDTTVYNLYEINALSGQYGNPGAVLAVQISMAAKPEALIALDRKMRMQREQVRREQPEVGSPSIWLIPLFEDLEAVQSIRLYLDRLWDYAIQSRGSLQTPQDRFSEMITEIFIAGSDLSQQVSQAKAAYLFHQAKYEIHSWLAEHGLGEAVRVKLGSGEPMQRQGGYYSAVAGQPAFLESEAIRRRLAYYLPAAPRRSAAFARTPLQGILLGGDLRTFQSNLAERLRSLPVKELSDVLWHVRNTQQEHRKDLIRAAETISESRLGVRGRGLQEMERLTIGTNDPIYQAFLEELTDNFRHILYGQEEDVFGLHLISFFIGKSLPQLRDRPTMRKASGAGAYRGQRVLASIAEIIPLSKQGSLLRAITHNTAQTMVLGVNQLTTGLFRALERFSQKAFVESDRQRMIAERILPRLPVYEILHTLRIYQDWRGIYLRRIESALPAGNSALGALREDGDAMQRYLPLFQQELLRRHGVVVHDFFSDGGFIQPLLPALRPDLAVLLQSNLFNTELDEILMPINGSASAAWQNDVQRLLEIPVKIGHWRARIWSLMEKNWFQRVQTFAELASALFAFSRVRSFEAPSAIPSGLPLPGASVEFRKTSSRNDDVRGFLVAAAQYLNALTASSQEAPVVVIRAMNDVKRLAQLEESDLTPSDQDFLRFCLLQIARIAGENG